MSVIGIKENSVMKKIVFAVLLGIALSGATTVAAMDEVNVRSVFPASIENVHTAVLAAAAEKGYTVTKDWRFDTFKCIAMAKAGGPEVRVCLGEDRNRTDVRVHGDDAARVREISDALRARY